MTPLPRQDKDSLLAALAAEHAAIYAYGVVQAYVRHPATTIMALKIVQEHRTHRDTIIDILENSGTHAPVAAPAYTLPNLVFDGVSAAQLAQVIENETAQAWRFVMERATVALVREKALHAITDCAIRVAQWRRNLSIHPESLVFPGSQ